MAIIKKIYTRTKDYFIIIELETGEMVVMSGTDQAIARNKFENELVDVEADVKKIDKVTNRGEDFKSLRRAVLEKVDGNYELRIVHRGERKVLLTEEAKLIIIT